MNSLGKLAGMEESLKKSLKTYADQVCQFSVISAIITNKFQLEQVEAALTVSDEGPDRDNLLSLRKDLQELIGLTKDTVNSPASSSASNNATDSDEFALFLREMEKEGALAAKSKKNDVDEELKALEGSKCRAPHQHQWGDVVYHNAMICSVSSSNAKNSEDVEV